MGLDVLTPKGQVTLEQERRVIAAFHKHYPGFSYIETDKTRDAVNDGVIVRTKTSTIVAVCETKCRGATLDDFERKWGYRWLMTHRKIKENAILARGMRVFFTGLLFLAESDMLLVQNLYDGNSDRWLVEYDVADTETQRTVNGGTTIRSNAFLDMRGARRFSVQ